MTNEEAIEVLTEHLKKANLAWDKAAFKKAIKALTPVPCQNVEQKSTITNAEWLINNGIKFTDIHIGLFPAKLGGNYKVMIYKDGTVVPIGQYPRSDRNYNLSEGETAQAFKEWLDEKHEDYTEPEPVLTGDERGYLKTLIRPFGTIIYIQKTYTESLEIFSKEYGSFRMPTGDYEYLGMIEGRDYKPEELGLL